MAQNRTTPDPLLASLGAGSISTRLKKAIESGVYANGDRIPPERQLAAAYGAARSMVRQALAQLEADGFVTRRVGAGTFVTHQPTRQSSAIEIADFISPLQLMDARFAVEPHMARLAALHANQRDIEHLQAILARLEKTGPDKDLFTELDSEFHLSIARASRNPLLLHVYETINAVRGRAQWSTMKDKILSPQQITAYNRQHRAIFEALRQRNPGTVAELLVQHLEKARTDLVGAESV